MDVKSKALTRRRKDAERGTKTILGESAAIATPRYKVIQVFKLLSWLHFNLLRSCRKNHSGQ
jgi:hypothetical protein